MLHKFAYGFRVHQFSIDKLFTNGCHGMLLTVLNVLRPRRFHSTTRQEISEILSMTSKMHTTTIIAIVPPLIPGVGNIVAF